jgi:hypothetical protein
MESRQKVLHRLLLGPEIAVQDGHAGDRTLTLLGNQLI